MSDGDARPGADAAADAHLRAAIRLALDNVRDGGAPFGAVLVRDGRVIATGVNRTATTHDPTAHAEIEAIRAASAALGSADLAGAVMHASGEPCPMCLAAMYFCGIRHARYAYSNAEAEPFGLSTAAIYADIGRPEAARRVRMEHAPVRLAAEPDLFEAHAARS